MFSRICIVLGAAMLAGCSSTALSHRAGGPADSAMAESPPSPASSVLDPSTAATEMAPSQPAPAGSAGTDPTTSMGDMKAMNMPGMGGGDKTAPPSAPNMQTIQGMQMPGMKASDPPQPQPATTQAAVLYTCTMHPQIQQDHPGNCPICGMKLVKKDPGAEAPKGDGQ